MNVYSFKDSSGAFNHPLAGQFAFAGQIGLGKFTVSMHTDRTAQAVASDGTVMVSAIAGDNGMLAIEVQQTSELHQFLLLWLNLCVQAQLNGDVSNWATATISIRNITTGTGHTLSGVSPSKMPDVPYEAQGQNLIWNLPAALVINF
jgi:hypothetical protein